MLMADGGAELVGENVKVVMNAPPSPSPPGEVDARVAPMATEAATANRRKY